MTERATVVDTNRLLQAYVRFRAGGGYIIALTIVLILWLGWNLLSPPTWHFDEAPFIVLNLLLSVEAAYAMPVFLRQQERSDEEKRKMDAADREILLDVVRHTKAILREVDELDDSIGHECDCGKFNG